MLTRVGPFAVEMEDLVPLVHSCLRIFISEVKSAF
jgi:hypothetical protein